MSVGACEGVDGCLSFNTALPGTGDLQGVPCLHSMGHALAKKKNMTLSAGVIEDGWKDSETCMCIFFFFVFILFNTLVKQLSPIELAAGSKI